MKGKKRESKNQSITASRGADKSFLYTSFKPPAAADSQRMLQQKEITRPPSWPLSHSACLQASLFPYFHPTGLFRVAAGWPWTAGYYWQHSANSPAGGLTLGAFSANGRRSTPWTSLGQVGPGSGLAVEVHCCRRTRKQGYSTSNAAVPASARQWEPLRGSCSSCRWYSSGVVPASAINQHDANNSNIE